MTYFNPLAVDIRGEKKEFCREFIRFLWNNFIVCRSKIADFEGQAAQRLFLWKYV